MNDPIICPYNRQIWEWCQSSYLTLGRKVNIVKQNVKELLQVVDLRAVVLRDDKMVSLFTTPRRERGFVNLQDWQNGLIFCFFFFSVLELEAQEEAASPDRELPLHTAESYPQTLACGLPFEGACLFLTFLVNLPWEHWIPSSWSTHSLCSNCLAWCRRYKPLQCLSRGEVHRH